MIILEANGGTMETDKRIEIAARIIAGTLERGLFSARQTPANRLGMAREALAWADAIEEAATEGMNQTD